MKIAVSGERSLPLEVEQALYRVLQEALANVARHAEADMVRLNLSMSAERVTLTVADNGCGFDLNAVSSHSLGLVGMKQRLAEAGRRPAYIMLCSFFLYPDTWQARPFRARLLL